MNYRLFYVLFYSICLCYVFKVYKIGVHMNFSPYAITISGDNAPVCQSPKQKTQEEEASGQP